jgi:uracil-DNA glycosylase family 4
MTMTNFQRSELYRLLCLAEDYVLDGFRHPHTPTAPRAPTEEPSAEAASEASSEASSEAPSEASPGAPSEGGADSLERVAGEVRVCTRCELHRKRTTAVPGEGSSSPRLLVVGEGPGYEEDRTGRPFVGPAGQYLDKWLQAIGLDRAAGCFIANVVKCRPPANRDPLPEESQACLPYLKRQIVLLRPRAILSVGRISTQILTGRSAGIGELRGTPHDFQGIPLVATYHPSAVLRNSALRKPVWEDLKRLRSILDNA